MVGSLRARLQSLDGARLATRSSYQRGSRDCFTGIRGNQDPNFGRPDGTRSLVLGWRLLCFSFVLPLRGNEDLLVDLEAMIEHDDQRQNYVVIPLLGKVKGKHHV